MEPENSAESSYRCPHCRALLVLGEIRWRGWVRCPECGQPGLPPERVMLRAALRRQPQEIPRDKLKPAYQLEPMGGLASPAFPAPASPTPRNAPSSASRVIASTGL